MVNLYKSQIENLLIPVREVKFLSGIFSFPRNPIFASTNKDDGLPFNELKKDIAKYSLKARLAQNSFGKATLRTIRNKNISNPQAYRIIIIPEDITIHSCSSIGAYYAIQTLRDLIAIFGNEIPAMTIDDEPDFTRRAIYHDCSRGKVPKLSTLKELVIRLAHWKINELQLYIENVFTFKAHPQIGKGFSPFTADEIISLKEHCKKYHVKLVGSLASFGHFEKILSLPQYSHLGEMPGFRGFLGGTTLCPIDPGSIKLIEQLYNEFIPLFDSDDFNVCCDETWELGKGRSKKEADKKGTGQVYLDFILKIHKLCHQHSKRMNLWADIVLKYPELLNKLPRDIVLLNWEYEQNGPNISRTKEIAKTNIPFMVCPGTSSWLTHGSRLTNSIGNVTNFASVGQKYNAEGLLNTDWGDNGHRNFLGISLHGFAHGAAHAWNHKKVDNNSFTEKFCNSFFNQKNSKLSDAIKTLGNTYITCGKTLPNKSLLYPALVEPLLPKKSHEPDAIDMMTEDGLQKIITQLSDNNLFPKSNDSICNFEQTALKELELASRMDCIAAKRALIGKKLRTGKSVKKSEFRKHANQMQIISDDFKKLWLTRNKSSRLRDNLKLFNIAKQESIKLAEK